MIEFAVIFSVLKSAKSLVDVGGEVSQFAWLVQLPEASPLLRAVQVKVAAGVLAAAASTSALIMMKNFPLGRAIECAMRANVFMRFLSLGYRIFGIRFV